MEYKILKQPYSHQLEKVVNEYIAKGWKPLGGVSIHNIFYCQAIIKETNE